MPHVYKGYVLDALRKGHGYGELAKVYEKANQVSINDIPDQIDDVRSSGKTNSNSYLVGSYVLLFLAFVFLLYAIFLSLVMIIAAGVCMFHSTRLSFETHRKVQEFQEHRERFSSQAGMLCSQFVEYHRIENAPNELELKAAIREFATYFDKREEFRIFVNRLYALGFTKEFIDEFYLPVFNKAR